MTDPAVEYEANIMDGKKDSTIAGRYFLQISIRGL